MPFSEIVGHDKQLATLRWALQRDRLHHAYLFLGPEGVGKKTVALSLAMAIHCLERVHDSCGACAHCVRIQGGNHPDVRVIRPSDGKKEISIQQVRELERELNFRAFSGRKKVAVVDPAVLMNFSAQNALLKTLEEPPRDSLLILISTSLGGLLPTILSRCIRLSFAPLAAELVTAFLMSHEGMGGEEAGLRAAITMGSMGKALSPDLEGLLRRRKEWVQRIGSLGQGLDRGWMALAEELAGGREEALNFLEWLEVWYRDILIYSVRGDSQGICNIDMIEDIKQQGNIYGSDRILFLLSQAMRTRARIRRNVNRKMALENFLAHMVGLH